MSSILDEDNDQTRVRREHLREIERLVGNPYPNKFARSRATRNDEGEDTITSLVREFRRYEPRADAEGERPSAEEANEKLKAVGAVRLAGRVATPPRVMGKAAFVHLSDGVERLQIYVRRQDARAVSNDSGQPVEEPESGWKLFQLLDHGDFVGVEGFLFITRTGELSVHVEQIQFLSKALVPMPDKLHGISDPEIRQRRRYADLIASSLKVEREPGELTTREVFERRSRMITQLRRYLDDHGYVEVETPMLSPIASGAAARPFKTHHNALDIDLYLRIAPELYLKRLVVGGFERVYELNRNYRNEGISYKHNPEFTMLEFYCAYMDSTGMMDFCEGMLKQTIQEVTGGTALGFGEQQIDFGQRFERLTMKQAIAKYWQHPELGGERFDISWLDEPKKLFSLHNFLSGIDQEKAEQGRGENGGWEAATGGSEATELRDSTHEVKVANAITSLFELVAESRLVQPTFIHDFPKPVSPLSKASPENPAVAERFELYIAGMEVANGFSELNDPVEQHQRFEEQMRQRERGDEEAMQMDEDYVRALSYGMPPAAGIGIGIDRLAMLLTGRRSIRDVILFPHMRPRAQAPAADEEEKDAPAESPGGD